jgi:hypothetical protein
VPNERVVEVLEFDRRARRAAGWREALAKLAALVEKG